MYSSPFRVLILGVGDAFTRHQFGSSALIEGPGGRVLLDCPDPIHRVLAEATALAGWKVEALDVHDVILTHLHGDHCNGLESLGFWQRFARLGGADAPRPRLHTSLHAAGRLWSRLAPAMDGSGFGDAPTRTLDDFYEVCLLEPSRPARIAGLRVECRFTRHPVPCLGLLVSDGRWTLGWSGDTPFEAEHLEWLGRADVIVHECNVGPAHTPIEALAALPAPLRARIRLIHLPDDFDPASTDMRPLRAGEVLQA